MKKPKIYNLLYTKSGIKMTQYAVVGSLADLNQYYRKNAKSLRSLISQVNKDYQYQYDCTYSIAYIEEVDAVPANVRVHTLNYVEVATSTIA